MQTVADARAAADGGADRLEVVRAITVGGLTPSLVLVEAIAAATSLPLRVMLRENGGFGTAPDEVEVMRAAARQLATMKIDGLVAGFAEAGRLRMDEFASVVDATPGPPITFHRAFDSLLDPLDAIDMLSAHPRIDGILTSGGEGTVEERSTRLRAYAARAGSRIAIIAGGGVDVDGFRFFAEERCVKWIHVGRAARDGRDPEGPVSAASVRRLRDLADSVGQP